MTDRRLDTPGAELLGVEVLSGPEELAQRAANEVLAVLGSALERSSTATWVLAGGSTPRRLYELLAEQPRALDWSRVELFWGDERCVEPSSAESNFALARDTLLAGLPFADDRVHRVLGERQPAEAARLYAHEIEAVLARGAFDLVLLGLGDDGHVASLFPGAMPPAGPLAAPVEAPVSPSWRVTMMPAALANSRRLVYLVHGGDKAGAVARALDPSRPPQLVTDQVRPSAGSALWLLDLAASVELAGAVVA